MPDLLQQQYDYVRGARAVLLDYIATMTDVDFKSSSPSFGRGSVRNLLVHICDTYQYWIADRALQLGPAFPDFEHYQNLDQCRLYFEATDRVVQQFLEKFSEAITAPLSIQRSNGVAFISPLELFTHVITHEFHHKGQIMSLSRELGYIPVDADIIR